MKLPHFLAVLCAALLVMLGIAIWFVPSNEDFRVENPFWNGTRELEIDIPHQPLHTLSDLPPDAVGNMLILVPYTPFTADDLATVKAWLDGGGMLMLADDYGYGNDVLAYLGVAERFRGTPLLDPLFNYKNGRLPRIFHFTTDDSEVTGSVQELVLNHATALSGVRETQVLASSSTFSFLDDNGNGEKDVDEPAGQFPVISWRSYGESRIILLADPSLLINSMAPLGDNALLRQNIAGMADTIYFDQSHLPPSRLTGAKDVLYNLRDGLAYPAVTLVLVVALVAGLLIPYWQRKGDRVE